jgi:dTDP-4-amino-4,6-dideoxygalactose transaminase
MSSDAPFLPFCRPTIGQEELDAVADVLSSGWLTTGPKTKQFELDFAAYVNAKHALAVNSCTAALHLAVQCLDLHPGDEVITTPLTFCATVNTILEAGGTPILADIGEDLNIDPDMIRKQITRRTKAIVPVHFAGLPCAMDQIWDLAKRHNLAIIEDAAHAVGAAYRGNPIGGGESDAVAFSFYATKNLSTGEGGMLTTPSEALADRMRILCLHGISRDAWSRYTEKGNWYYEVVERGYKYNISDLMAAIGIQQLKKLTNLNARRAAITAQYNAAFVESDELELPPDRADSTHAWHLYVLRFNLSGLTADRAQILIEMRTRGIGCSVHFIPIPLHPFYRTHLEFRDPCTRAISEFQRSLSLPLYSALTDDDVARVIEAVRDVIARNRKFISIAGFAAK